jgi:short-subunit dehydrogenase
MYMNQRIVLTGASAGIGEQLALALAARGARLVLAARSADALEALAARCRAQGAQAFAVPTDVSVQGECERLIDQAVEKLGGIDVLIHNAGISMWTRFDEVTDLSIFEKVMRVNYLGPVWLTHRALPALKQSRGLIVAVSSLTGKTGVPTRSGYAASKHAMQGFFDSLRIELAGAGVAVSVISPGFVRTDIRSRAFGPDGKPRAESPREESSDETMSVEECVSIMLDAIEHRRRDVVMTKTARFGLWLKMVAPAAVDRIALRKLKARGE